jgi:hypothetical protein
MVAGVHPTSNAISEKCFLSTSFCSSSHSLLLYFLLYGLFTIISLSFYAYQEFQTPLIFIHSYKMNNIEYGIFLALINPISIYPFDPIQSRNPSPLQEALISEENVAPRKATNIVRYSKGCNLISL